MVEGTSFGGENQGFGFECAGFEMENCCRRMGRGRVVPKLKSLEFRVLVWAGDIHLGIVSVDMVLKPLAWGSLRVLLDGVGDKALGLSSLGWTR